jgi:hypothetical protein
MLSEGFDLLGGESQWVEQPESCTPAVEWTSEAMQADFPRTCWCEVLSKAPGNLSRSPGCQNSAG